MTNTNDLPGADANAPEKNPPSVPVDFILKHQSDGGVGLLLASMRTGEPYWRSLMEGGIADRLFSSRSHRASFLNQTAHMKDVGLAEEVLRTCLSKLPAAKRKKFFDCPSTDRDSSAIHAAIVNLSKEAAKPRAGMTATVVSPNPEVSKLIIRLGQEVKADFNLPQKVRLKRQDPIKVSPMVSSMYDHDIPTIRAYVDLGLRFGDEEIKAAGKFLENGFAFGVDLLRFAVDEAGVDPLLFKAAASAEKAPAEALSMINAALARKAVGEILAKRAPQPA